MKTLGEKLHDDITACPDVWESLSDDSKALWEAQAVRIWEYLFAGGDGASLIMDERDRQVKKEGFTEEHDAEHTDAELIQAARAYALMAEAQQSGENCVTFDGIGPEKPPTDWPWELRWWKPSNDPIRNLVKAGALIAAEIDRLMLAGFMDEDEDEGEPYDPFMFGYR